MGKSRTSGGTGGFHGEEGGAAPLACVVIVRVVVWAPALGVTEVGLNADVVCAGNPATVKETGLANPFASGVGVTVIVITA